MASFHRYSTPATAHAASFPNKNHHGGSRNRRASRLSVSHTSQRQFRGARSFKDLNETASLSAFRVKFEAGRSFELEDDLEFCPNLLTANDLVSISSASERSSLASNSPESSPTQRPQIITPALSLNSSSPAFVPPLCQAQPSSLKLHQPSATRGRNAIPIINPSTGISMSSPPPFASPAAIPQSLTRRW